jgi:hypothetical protein
VIAFNCPKCKAELEFGDAAAGRIVRCPDCQVKLRLPGELSEERKPRRKKRRRIEEEESTEPSPTPEWLAPSIILGLGLTLSVGSLAVAGGTVGAAAGAVVVLIRLVFSVPLGIAGLFIAAPLLGTSFGTIGMAILKLAAINVLNVAILMMAEFSGAALIGYPIGSVINFLLFKWLFELEFTEAMFSVVVIGLIQFMAMLTVTAVALRTGH